MNAIASTRTWLLAKYLARLGAVITVVTPDPQVWLEPNYRPAGFPVLLEEGYIRVRHTGLGLKGLTSARVKCTDQKLSWLINGLSRRLAAKLRIEPEIGWKRPLKTALAELDPDHFDVILASGGPFLSFPVAAEFSRRWRKPLVLDYRDFWSQNPHLPALHGPINRRRERQALAQASCVTTVSPTYESAMAAVVPGKCMVRTITNGFDPEEMARIDPEAGPRHDVVYLGTLYPPTRDLTPVFLALRQLRESGFQFPSKTPFHYYGIDSRLVTPAAEEHGVATLVQCHPNVSRAEALQIQAGSKLSVVLISNGAESTVAEKGILTGKLFELLGLGVRSLVIAPPDADARKVVQNVPYFHFAGGSEVPKIAAIIADSLKEPRARSRPSCEFSWTQIADDYAGLLRCVLSGDYEKAVRTRNENA